MDVFGLLAEKMDFSVTELRNMINTYDRLEDTDLMDQSSVIFDNIRTILKVDANLFYPRLEYATDFARELDHSKQIHEDVNYILEHAIMIHVDEPFDEYLDKMKKLWRLMEQYRRHNLDVIYPFVQRLLSDEDMRDIQNQVLAQMQHESIPAKGFKIY